MAAFLGVAPALNKLLAQLNALAPKRSKLSDGALGDAAHAATVSFHNPNSVGIVQARDFTHDPGGGLDCNWLAAALVASGDKRIYELIWSRRYWTPARGWVPYLGTNRHDKHLHLTVRSDPALYNSTAPWDLGADSEEFTVAQYEDLMAAIGQVRDEAWTQHKDAQNVRSAYHQQVMNVLVGSHTDGTDRLTDLWNAILGQANPQAAVDPAAIAAFIPADIAEQVVDALTKRLAG